MEIFSIRDIEHLTGIKAHTLRVWEKRYGIIIPPTAPGKHRVYDNNDLKHILRIATLYHKGVKISKIAEMSIDEIQRTTQTPDPKSNFEAFIGKLLEYTHEGNDTAFKRLMAELREMMGEINMYLHVIFPFLSRIGDLWLNDKITPLQEHFASNIIRNELIISIDNAFFAPKQKNPKILLFSPPGEQHDIPLLFGHYILRSRKINAIYLGVNTSDEILESVANKTQADWLLTYLITNLSSDETQSYANKLSKKFDDRKIMLCGPGFKHTTNDAKNVTLARSMSELVSFCLSL